VPAQAWCGVTFAFTDNKRQRGYHSWCSDSLLAGRFGFFKDPHICLFKCVLAIKTENAGEKNLFGL